MFYTKFADLCYGASKTPSAVAQELGLARATVTYWKKNPNALPKANVLRAIAEYFNVPISYLTDSQQENDVPEIVDLRNYGLRPIETKTLPLVGRVACGEPITTDRKQGVYVKSGADIQADFCLIARGDSMTGARINGGDIVFIRAQDGVDNGEIAAVIVIDPDTLDDTATLKRVYFYPNKKTLILRADNPKYEDIIFIGDEINRVRIIGKAVSFQSRLV